MKKKESARKLKSFHCLGVEIIKLREDLSRSFGDARRRERKRFPCLVRIKVFQSRSILRNETTIKPCCLYPHRKNSPVYDVNLANEDFNKTIQFALI